MLKAGPGPAFILRSQIERKTIMDFDINYHNYYGQQLNLFAHIRGQYFYLDKKIPFEYLAVAF